MPPPAINLMNFQGEGRGQKVIKYMKNTRNASCNSPMPYVIDSSTICSGPSRIERKDQNSDLSLFSTVTNPLNWANIRFQSSCSSYSTRPVSDGNEVFRPLKNWTYRLFREADDLDILTGETHRTLTYLTKALRSNTGKAVDGQGPDGTMVS